MEKNNLVRLVLGKKRDFAKVSACWYISIRVEVRTKEGVIL